MSLHALLGCILALTPQADEVKTVSIDSAGLTVEEILAKVREQSGLEVYAGNVATNRIVAVVPSLPSKIFLERLAWALDAEWQPYGKGVRLERTPSQFAASRSRAYAARLTGIRLGLSQAAKSFSRLSNFSQKEMDKKVEQAMEEFRRQYSKFRGNEEDKIVNLSSGGNPAYIILQEVLLKMPAKTLADLNPKLRTVFSTSPTRFQRSIPFAISSVEDFLAARKTMAETAKKVRSMTSARVYTGVQGEDKKIDGIGKILVRVGGDGRRDYVQMDILVANTAGELIGQANCGIYARTTENRPSTLPNFNVTARPDSMKLAKALIYGNRESTSIEYDVIYPSTPWKLDETCRQVEDILIDPVTHEPLSYGATDVVQAAAEKLKKPVIAYISDDHYSRLVNLQQQKQINFNSFIQPSDVEVQNGDCFLIRPADLDEAVNSQWDRTRLKTLLEKVRKVGYLRLSDLIDYRKGRVGTINYGSSDFRWIGACSQVISNQMTNTNQDSLDVLSAFGWTSDRFAAGTVNIPFAQWPQSVKGKFQELVESGRFRVNVGRQTELQQHEPTELSDEQLTYSVSLRVSTAVTDIAYAMAEGEKTGRFLAAYQIGYRKNPLMAAQNTGLAQFPRVFKSYRPASLKTISIAFALTRPNSPVNPPADLIVQSRSAVQQMSNFEMGFGALTDVVSISDTPVSEDQLPESFRKGIESSSKGRGPMYNPTDRGYRPVIPP